jgi:hypothetical protein
MRIAVRTIQFIVALLFIFSGLIKANDSWGLAYKMDEFFELWISGLKQGHFFAKTPLISLLHFLDQHILFLSVTMITLEIVTGVALLVGWMKKPVLYLLLVLIIFFTFLTGYAYLSGKFTNCGCFGDCLPITPLTSFIKDLALLLMIIFLLLGQKNILPVLSKSFRAVIVIISLALTLFLQWYVLNYLPLLDCLPMKKGNNISEQTKPPKDAIPSVYETRLVYENAKTGEVKDMSQDEFNNSKIWEDSNWKWKETKTKLLRKGTDTPKLQNFSLTTASGTDTTEAVLNETGPAILYFVNPDKKGQKIDDAFLKTAEAKGASIFFVTTDRQSFSSDAKYPVLTCDGTVYRIAARVNPTIYLLKQGTIVGKWAGTELNKAAATINNLKQ